MAALHTSTSNFTPTNLICSSPISANPNLTTTTTIPDSLVAPKSAMAESSLFVFEAGANKENICPVTNLAANSGVSPKRRRFVRKPLADITNQFKQRNSSFDGLLRKSDACDGQKMLKRKAGLGVCDGVVGKMNCRSKTLRMSFR
ncbi:unnamed protein product [Rhodiola kirilowii]